MRAPRTSLIFGLFFAEILLTSFWCHAETQTENIVAEQRTVLYLRVTANAAQAFLPSGFSISPVASGVTKDANLILLFVDRKLGLTPDGKPLFSGTTRLVGVLIPSKNNRTEEPALMVVDGYSANPAMVPGPYKVYSAASVGFERMEKGNGNETTIEETWTAKAMNGNGLSLHLIFNRGLPSLSSFDLRALSGADPNFYRIYRGDQLTDVMRSVNTGVDRLRSIELKVSGGGKLSSAINGTQKVIAATSVPFYRRLTFVP
jgi:hypothetical protein